MSFIILNANETGSMFNTDSIFNCNTLVPSKHHTNVKDLLGLFDQIVHDYSITGDTVIPCSELPVWRYREFIHSAVSCYRHSGSIVLSYSDSFGKIMAKELEDYILKPW